MKSITTALLISVLSLQGAALAEDSAQSTESTILALEQRWAEAERANTPDAAAPLLSEDCELVSAQGEVRTKAEFLATDRATRYEHAEVDKLKIRVYGDTAVSTGIFRAKGTSPDGTPFDIVDRMTNTWVKMPDGQWQVVANHQTAAAK